MTRLHLRFTEEATAQVNAADAWWRENRASAATVFSDELRAVTELVTRVPGIGAPYSSRSLDSVRRAYMRRTRLHAYYVVRGDELVIVAVWSGRRGHGPPLAAVP